MLRPGHVWTAACVVTLTACGSGVAGPFGPPSVEIVSGDGQPAKAGQFLKEPLTIRVLDGKGLPMSLVQIRWRVSQGSGAFPSFDWWGPEDLVGSMTSETNQAGMAQAYFRPQALGMTVVEARARTFGGEDIGTVAFTFDATSLVVNIDWCGDESVCFLSPEGTSRASVPAGVPVEWVNLREEVASVTSRTVPEGGSAFSSGPLGQAEVFVFVPEVAGTWTFVEEETGATGELTAM